MAFEIEWSENSLSHLEGVWLYIAQHSPDNADRFIDKVRTEALSLKSFPERGRPVPELRSRSTPPFLEIIIGNYRLIYQIVPPKITILGFVNRNRLLRNTNVIQGLLEP